MYTYLVFTTGYPNQKSKVLGSYRPPVRFSLFHERFKFPSKGGRQLESPPLSTGPHLMDKLLCYLRMVRVPQLFNVLTLSRGRPSLRPRVWPLLSPVPRICLVTSSYIRVLILSGLRKCLYTSIKVRKTCTNNTIGVDTSSRDIGCGIKDAFNHPSVLEWFATDPVGLSMVVVRYPLRRYNFYALTV